MWDLFAGAALARRTQSVLMAWLPPVMLATFALLVFVVPSVSETAAVGVFRNAASKFDVNKFLFCGLLAFTLAVTGFMVRSPLYRLVEGYSWPQRIRRWRVAHAHEPQSAWLQALRETQRAQFHAAASRALTEQMPDADPGKAAVATSADLDEERREKWEQRLAQADIARQRRGRTGGALSWHRPWRRPALTFNIPDRQDVEGRWENPYPPDDKLLPTKVGNAFRVMESYGSTNFGLDSQILWHELVAEASPPLLDALNDAELHADTYLSLYWSSLGFTALSGLALVDVVATESPNGVGLGIAVAAGLGLSVMSYRGLIGSAVEWGTVVRAVVNTCKEPLRRKYGLKVPDSVEDERALWEALTGFVYYGDHDRAKELDRWRSTEAQAPQQNSGQLPGP